MNSITSLRNRTLLVLLFCVSFVVGTQARGDEAEVLEMGAYEMRLIVPEMPENRRDVAFPAELVKDGEKLVVKTRGMMGNAITLTGFQDKGGIKFGMTDVEKSKLLSFHYLGEITGRTAAEGKFQVFGEGKLVFGGTWTLSKPAHQAASAKERIRFTLEHKTASPDGKLFAGYYRDGLDEVISIHDAETGKQIKRIVGHGDNVTKFEFTPDGKVLASRCVNSGRKGWALWDVSSGKLILRLKD